MASKISDKALQVVDKIVRDMPDNEKEGIFNSIATNKKSRDHILKIILWTYCSKDILNDVKKREALKAVVDRLEKKKARELKHQRAMAELEAENE